MAENKGIVYLVGAGPGDPGLMTRRSLELIAEADAILYDRLIPPGALDRARTDARLVYVGKQPGGHTMRQEEINELLVALGREGKRVVRLKGGDPFVFGRGGEEALALAEAGVPWEVVPGVSSAIAAPAYAGIPVTYRGLAGAFAVATGHQGLDRPGLVHADTLVVLMAVDQLDAVVNFVLAHGRPADTPAALVQAASTPDQRTITATLATILEAARDQAVAPPAALVIGPTVRLADRLQWFRPGGERDLSE
jgi:uroporphyrin-III C-methyltransferase